VELKRLESKTRRLLRSASRTIVLALGVVCALRVLPWEWAAMALPALSPYVAICATIGGRALRIAAIPGLAVAVVVLFRPRWFCRVVCPVGLLIEQAGRLRPKARPRVARVPPIGQWVVLLTLAGAIVGYPLLLWLDPLALFNSLFTGWRQPLEWTRLIVGIGLPLILLLGLLWPFLWCRRLCPLGATQDLLALLRRLLRRRRQEADPLAPRRANPLPRRAVLAVAAGAGASLATVRWGHAATGPLRPPGAVGEERFTGLCVRCGNCVRACPEKIIQPDLGEHGVAGLLAPVVTFDYAYCRPDCTRCMQVCPSGAIARLSLAEKEMAPIGVARVEMSLCLLSQQIECGACIGPCAYGAVTIDFNEDDYSSTVRVDPELCTGCGACEVVCMTTPRRAIRVHPIDRARGTA